MSSQPITEFASESDLAIYFRFLDGIRSSGAVNMFGAGPYLKDAFDLTRDQSHAVLDAWMNAFCDESAETRATAALQAERDKFMRAAQEDAT